ncbi:hypothetical protein B0T26DRAFT_77343 [Lasiosphaeria miniovina]|uniref:Uncharacterized protein n=1 Tax=Lasiosphaeria miniovina TaxID=1954250 RepID=A0AA40BI26_9PEZI|nr:uncharacterized protein B0T26DRAFT_77343 [Lasiosphaeria miniovina]KAK0734622.1 hypothetical protein B0T26DRAFT_77343 [Lasiosphaeria miniovina]
MEAPLLTLSVFPRSMFAVTTDAHQAKHRSVAGLSSTGWTPEVPTHRAVFRPPLPSARALCFPFRVRSLSNYKKHHKPKLQQPPAASSSLQQPPATLLQTTVQLPSINPAQAPQISTHTPQRDFHNLKLFIADPRSAESHVFPKTSLSTAFVKDRINSRP